GYPSPRCSQAGGCSSVAAGGHRGGVSRGPCLRSKGRAVTFVITLRTENMPMRRTDAHQRRRTWFYTGVALVGALPLAALACGGDDSGSSDGTSTNGNGGSGMGGSAGDDGGPSAGGTSNGGSGTTAGGGSGGASTFGGSGGEVSTTDSGGSSNTDGGSGGTGGAPAVGDIDNVIAAVCNWEFKCCDEGERAYRLSPFAEEAES